LIKTIIFLLPPIAAFNPPEAGAYFVYKVREPSKENPFNNLGTIHTNRNSQLKIIRVNLYLSAGNFKNYILTGIIHFETF